MARQKNPGRLRAAGARRPPAGKRPAKSPARMAPERAKAAPTARGESTRARLLEAARVLFLEHGFHAASMRQIADAAGVALGGIYNHYPNKEAIFAAVLDAYHPYHTLLPALERTEGETVEGFIRNAGDLLYREVRGAESELMPLVFIELVEFQGRHLEQMAERLAPALLTFVQRFSGLRGRLRPLPPQVLFRTFLALVAGFLISEIALKTTPILSLHEVDWFGGMMDIYLHGILDEPAAHSAPEA